MRARVNVRVRAGAKSRASVSVRLGLGLELGEQGAGCGGWTARVQGTEVTAPAALGLKWQSLLLVRSARTSRSL